MVGQEFYASRTTDTNLYLSRLPRVRQSDSHSILATYMFNHSTSECAGAKTAGLIRLRPGPYDSRTKSRRNCIQMKNMPRQE